MSISRADGSSGVVESTETTDMKTSATARRKNLSTCFPENFPGQTSPVPWQAVMRAGT
jgi:hypothetical protein